MLTAAKTKNVSFKAFSLERCLYTADSALQRFALLAAALVILVFCGWVWLNSNALRLRYDELLEVEAANAPTVHQLLSYLAAGVDYNPPLSHLLVRSSMAVFGTADWAPRLPSFLGVLLCLICLYRVISQWLSPKYGVLSILWIICSPVRIHAGEARPYGLVLGLTGLALIFYQHVTKPRRNVPALVAFAICNACLAASHYYAVLVISPFLLAEAARVWKSRQWNWPLLACIIAPPFIVFAFLRDAIRSQHVQLAHYFSRGNLLSFNHGYEVLELDPLVYGIALTLLAGAVLAVIRKDQPVVRINRGSFESPGLLLGIGLLLLPLEGAVCTQFITHAYVSRYFLPAEIGSAICVCYLAEFAARFIPGTAVALIVALSINFGNIMAQQLSHPASSSLPGAPLYGAQTPILFDSPEDYLRVLHYEPDFWSKMLVIADPAASMRARQYDTDDKIMLALASEGRVQTTTLSTAARQWSHFSLVPRPQEYTAVLQCLVNAGGRVTLVRGFAASNFLFDVVVPPENLGRLDTCASTAP